jgi:integrase
MEDAKGVGSIAARRLLAAPNLFYQALEAVKRDGLVGEEGNALALLLVVVSRVLRKPLSAVIRGASSSGKNFLATRITNLLPPDMLRELTSASPKSWFYSKDDFRHRVVYQPERNEESGSVIPLRMFISEGKLIHWTVDFVDGVRKQVKLEVEGPVSVISTTNRGLETDRAKRDYAMLAMLFGCGFRRSELVGLDLDEIQMRQGHWAVVDLIGKGGHIRTVPIPGWVKAALDQWIVAARVTEGRIFRAVARGGGRWGKGISQNVVWYVVKTCCERVGLEHIAPHDLRRTCAKLCHSSGGELEQIQFLLGHASVQTTERYLGCKQNLGHPVNDLFDLKTNVQPKKDHVESVVVKDAALFVEKPSPQGVECRHGGSEHDQPIGDPRQISLPERTDLVEVGKTNRPHSLRRCSEAGTSGSNAESKADGQSDQRPRRSVGSGTLPDPTS